MKREIVKSKEMPAAIGPYSQAVKVGELVFTSGQIPLNPKTGELVHGGIEEQIRQAIGNLKVVLEAAGASLETTVKTTLFIVQMEDFPKINKVYAELFHDANPARSCVAVSALPKGAQVEVEAIAMRCSTRKQSAA
ncbi:MAG: reactive intermediate/imine deaminase [Syntrophobacterales bacterium CG_4_8_14_3_um_filter_58_8]|nr:MAG: reactive intermediate/imine deaminase [Syntrophaceae bacterium CG2_30_58_14]PIV02281.1 MAG: reactive intermediate/imine deaminase [Syntrophobacterales bacterium CG03_land_8_20_14_0_80_58_14]PJC73704.1 MAG: reactive intermediate/imine deaminase [Syntrophobacterales bacterium CG_4_8_14_3_um_filter_58_8]